MRVLVAGAGGMLGKEIVKSLNQRGIVPDGLAYSKKEFERVESPLSRKLCLDVTKPLQLEGICKGIDIVISTIGITRLAAEITHMDVDFQGNLNLLHEAQKDGVKKFVFISPAGANLGHKEVPLFEAKYLFEEDLQKSGMGWLIFRSGGFYKDFADYGKAGANGKSWVINGGLNKSTPIAITDLAEIMVADSLKEENKVIEVGGPEDLNWKDICQICAEALETKTKIVSVPTWLCNFSLWLIRPFSHKYYAMGKLLVYTSTHDLPTPKRGKIKFSDYVKNYYNCNCSK
jgi:uncharacterized protein YbjT (DUF2867 family)